MNDSVWKETARHFANPTFTREWMPPDRPDWPYAASAVFRSWLVARLEEFVPVDGSIGFLSAARANELDPYAPAVGEALHDTLSRIDFGRVGRRYARIAMQITKSGRSPDLAAIERAMLNEEEALASGAKRRGQARDANPSDHRKAVVRASRDIWNLREVIIPRFWPDLADKKEIHIPGGKDTVIKVIAERYDAVSLPKEGVSPTTFAQLAWSEYYKSRQASSAQK